MASLSCKISPRTSTVIFLDKSPFATQVTQYDLDGKEKGRFAITCALQGQGSPIIGYQVLIVRPNTWITTLPKIVLDVMMPPTATRMEVPDGFLQRNSTYEWEVLAIESGGNQTLSSRKFRTR